MGRALRRTLSGHLQHEVSSSVGSCPMNTGFVSQRGGSASGGGTGGGEGGVVCGVVVAPSSTSRGFLSQHPQQEGGSQSSSLTSLPSGSVGPRGSSSKGSRSQSYLPGTRYNLSKLFPFYCRRIIPRSTSMEKPVKSKGILYRKHLVQLLICFVLGLLLGCAPLGWFGLWAGRDSARHELAVEVNNFVTNMQRVQSRSGEKLIDVEPGEGFELEEVEKLSAEDDSTDGTRGSKVDVSEESFLEIAPGLNYSFDPERKLIIVVTATYNRPFQAHFLTRLSHTLRLVPPPLLWLVVEYPWASYETAGFLRQTGIMHRHLVCRDNITNFRDRRFHQRNRALMHIEMHQLDGIVYFADDDNIYSVELFEELRKIKRFGIWPVGMLAENRAKTVIEGPVCDGEKVIGWHTAEKSKRLRRFHTDMSGFGFNSTMLWNRTMWRRPTDEPIRQLTNKEGLQETTFIEQLVEDESQMEGLPSGCNKIMVWHLHLDRADLYYPPGWTLPSTLGSNTPLRP